MIISLILACEKVESSVESDEGPYPHQLISHAAGSIYGYRNTNSMEALEESYENGFRLIEIDFDWTIDNKVVAIHDWTDTLRRLFMIEDRILSLEEFKTLDTFQDLTLMDLDDLVSWLKVKKDAYIITDVKNKNIEFLELIVKEYSDIQDQMIPQIYSFEEYDKVEDMGYDNIILTLYKTEYTDEEIIEFTKDKKLFAITMPIERGYTELPMKLNLKDIPVYVHTVNDLYIFEELYENGVTGIYTDYFYANKLSLQVK